MHVHPRREPARGASSAGGRPASETPWAFHLNNGALCLDFANTVSWRGSRAPADHLPSYGEFIRFAQQSGLLSADEARRLQRAAARHPGAAARVLRQAVVLREALYRIFAGLAGGRSPQADDLRMLNGALPSALTRLQVAGGAQGFTWLWEGDSEALERLVWPVARDAAVFLTSIDLSRLRTCANPGCRWVFYDGTRSRTRRWCSMAHCGNRDKVRRFREQQRRARLGRSGRGAGRPATGARPRSSALERSR